jgi:hypothetical protein
MNTELLVRCLELVGANREMAEYSSANVMYMGSGLSYILIVWQDDAYSDEKAAVFHYDSTDDNLVVVAQPS